MNKKNFKAFLAVLLTVVMVFAIVPMSVSAADPAATISFADAANRTVFTAEQQVWVQNGITVTNNKAGSSNDVADYSNPVRMYAGSDVIIAYAGMTQIVIECSSEKYATACGNSITGATVSVDGTTVTVTLASAVDSFAISALTAQTRVSSISVYTTATEGGAGDPPADTGEYDTLTIPEFVAIAEALENKGPTTTDKYYVTGTIKNIANPTYGNMTIEDANGNSLFIYGLYNADGSVRYDELETKPVVGDTVTLLGVASNYNGAQMKNAWMTAYTPGEGPETSDKPEDPAADSTLTIEEAIALGASKDHNTYTEGKYYVTGVITEVYNTTYGNMKIKDNKGNILTIYGTFSADGSDRYDAMAKQPQVGDTVKIYGIVGQYNGTAQIKNGWIVEHTPSTPATTGDATIVLIGAVMLAGVVALCVVSRKRRYN